MRAALTVVMRVALALAIPSTHAQSFHKVDADGAHHWASHPTDSSFSSSRNHPSLAFAQPGAGDSPRALVKPDQISREGLVALIVDASLRHGVEPAWVLALIEVESRFDVKAISPKGAIGLMQLMPGTAKQYGLSRADDLLRPEVNVSIGVRHLKALLDRHQNNWPVVLAAYNAGENAVVSRGHRIPAFRETLLYVPSVLARVEVHRVRLDASMNK